MNQTIQRTWSIAVYANIKIYRIPPFKNAKKYSVWKSKKGNKRLGLIAHLQKYKSSDNEDHSGENAYSTY